MPIKIVAAIALLMSFLSGAVRAADDFLFADFEGEDYGAWKAEGSAFGTGPTRGTLRGQMPVEGFAGKALVNSFLGGDGPTGKLVSPEFKIERSYVSFLIGGGGYADKTCMNLLVEGKAVRTATGPNTQPGGSEMLAPGHLHGSNHAGGLRQRRLGLLADACHHETDRQSDQCRNQARLNEVSRSGRL